MQGPAVTEIDSEERRRRLMRRHHLLEDTAPSTGDVVRDLVGLHSSDPATVFLAACARTGQGLDSVDDALYGADSLVRLHGMRRTLWVMTREHAALAQTGVSSDIAVKERRRVVKGLADAGLAGDPDAWLDERMSETESVVADMPGISTREITDSVPGARQPVVLGGPKWGGEVPVSSRLLSLLAMEGRIVRGRPAGSWLSSQYVWMPVDGGEPEVSPEEARASLVRDWLATFGPASFDDIAWWFGWGIRKTRAALGELTLDASIHDGRELLVLEGDTEPTPEHPPTATLLPSLDPSIMGWKDRGWMLGPHESSLFDQNGNAGPIVLLDGRAIGTWSQQPDGAVITHHLEDLGTEGEALVEAAAQGLTTLLDGVIVRPRFPSPASRGLAGRLAG